MKVQSATSDSVMLTRASDGAQVPVPNGTKVIVIDDKGYKQLKNGFAKACDMPCDYEGDLYFVDKERLASSHT